MYKSSDLAIKIKEVAQSKDVKLKEMWESCGLGSNTMSSLNHEKKIAFDSLAKVADYLEVSVDYLLGRSEQPTQTINNQESNKGIQAHTYNAGAEERKLDDVSEELLKEFKKLSLKDKGEAIRIICEMAEKEK